MQFMTHKNVNREKDTQHIAQFKWQLFFESNSLVYYGVLLRSGNFGPWCRCETNFAVNIVGFTFMNEFCIFVEFIDKIFLHRWVSIHFWCVCNLRFHVRQKYVVGRKIWNILHSRGCLFGTAKNTHKKCSRFIEYCALSTIRIFGKKCYLGDESLLHWTKHYCIWVFDEKRRNIGYNNSWHPNKSSVASFNISIRCPKKYIHRCIFTYELETNRLDIYDFKKNLQYTNAFNELYFSSIHRTMVRTWN